MCNKSACNFFADVNSVAVKTEADDVPKCSHDDQPTTGKSHYPQMPIGMLRTELFVFFLCLFVCPQHQNHNGQVNGQRVDCHAPAACCYVSLSPPSACGVVPVPITGALVFTVWHCASAVYTITTTLSSLASIKHRMDYHSGTGLSRLSWKKAVKWVLLMEFIVAFCTIVPLLDKNGMLFV